MAKVHLDRLKKRYGYTGGALNELMQDVLATQNENITKKIAKRSKAKWDIGNKKIKNVESRLILPDLSDVLPKRSIHILKAAENGKLLSDKLRDGLTKNLRNSMDTFTPKTGEQNFVIRRGTLAGKINPKLINKLQTDLTKTFKNYTKKDPSIGVPKNIRAIAITEFRSPINNMKFEYADKLLQTNPDIIMRKGWIHNKSLSKEPRRGHIMQEKRGPIKMTTLFKVPIIIKVKGRFRNIGTTNMRSPHDPTAPAAQNVNCNCDVTFIVKRRDVKKKVQKSLLDCNRGERLKVLKSYSEMLTNIVNRLKNN